VKAFKIKSKLLRSQLLKGEMCHFPICAQQIPQHKHTELGEIYAMKIDDLVEESDRRLALSKEEDIQLKMTEDPFSVDSADLPFQLQLNRLIFGDQHITEISTEKAVCTSSTKVWTVKSIKILLKVQ
jgi:hypothetical protein